ncbi:MAG TPA: L-histidine N(alpha)-methyltransferase [Candidatus Angelobacter sp.]|nr:L-histidine N(alpha)-methyltransferase [Candidatus Angelobacter sp.]
MALSPIAEDVLQGLSASPKRLPPKLFYDEAGSHLFEQITELPEYYLTRTERAIFQTFAKEIIQQAGNNLTLIELGAGSASKTAILIQAMCQRQLQVDFYPVDVSAAALQGAVSSLNGSFPRLHVRPIVADYSHGVSQLASLSGRKLVLLIGSTIGNFEPQEALRFMRCMRESLRAGDAFLLGFDMVKSSRLLHAAYNDSQRITARFNQNVLVRINSELGGRFAVDQFRHVAFWNRTKSRIEMHLESLQGQNVWIEQLEKSFHFMEGETIHTENSYKYSANDISNLLRESGFMFEKSWTDPQQWFSVVLARAGEIPS